MHDESLVLFQGQYRKPALWKPQTGFRYILTQEEIGSIGGFYRRSRNGSSIATSRLEKSDATSVGRAVVRSIHSRTHDITNIA